MRTLSAKELLQNMAVYPRKEVDREHVLRMVDSMNAGIKFPPVVICKRTRAVADGMHRLNAAIEQDGEDAVVDVLEKDYANAKEIFLDAIRLNAAHGKPLTTLDRQHCVLTCRSLGIGDGETARVFGVNEGVVVSLVTSTPKRSVALSGRGTRQHTPARQTLGRRSPPTPANVRTLEQKIVEAAVLWHGAEDDEVNQTTASLSEAVQAYLDARE